MKKILLLSFFFQVVRIFSQEVELGSNDEIRPLKVYDDEPQLEYDVQRILIKSQKKINGQII